MKTTNTKIVVYSELLLILFLVIRGIAWVINHTVSHHILDNLSLVAIFLLAVMFILATPTNSKEANIQTGIASWLVGLGIVSIIVGVAGFVAVLADLSGNL